MPAPDEAWTILKCPECGGLMKVAAERAQQSVACPSCGARFDPAAAGAQPTAGAQAEVIRRPAPRSGSQSQPEAQAPQESGGAPPRRAGLPDPLAAELPNSLPPPPAAPDIGAVAARAKAEAEGAAGSALPAKRREEFRVPELISNVGERTWAPGAARPEAPSIDPSRIARTDEERFAVDPEQEELQRERVNEHFSRRLAKWDLDEDEDGAAPQATPSGPTLRSRLAVAGIGLVSALFLGLIIYGVVQSLRSSEPPRAEGDVPEAEIARAALTETEREVLNRPAETFAKAGEAITGFLNASSYRERLEFCRDPQRVEPMMVKFHEEQGYPDGPVAFRSPDGDWPMRPYNEFLLATVELDDFSERAIAVERQADGSYLVDWESFYGYSEIPWGELAERRPREPVLVRARASIGDYFNFGYGEDEWACVRLQDPRNDHVYYGYLRLDDPQLRALGGMMRRYGESHVTIRVAYPEDAPEAGPNQLRIVEAVAAGWVHTEPRGAQQPESADAG